MLASFITLLALIALTAGFVVYRLSEVRLGVRAYDNLRTKWDARALELYDALVLGGIPHSWRRFIAAVLHEIVHETVHFLVLVLRAVERPLSRLSYRMRVSAPKTGAAPVSEFLKTITPDKTVNTGQNSPSTI